MTEAWGLLPIPPEKILTKKPPKKIVKTKGFDVKTGAIKEWTVTYTESCHVSYCKGTATHKSYWTCGHSWLYCDDHGKSPWWNGSICDEGHMDDKEGEFESMEHL